MSTAMWHKQMVDTTGVQHAISEDLAATQMSSLVTKKGLLSGSDIASVCKLGAEAQRHEVAHEVRSAPLNETWKVFFLQSGGMPATELQLHCNYIKIDQREEG